jgi:hypothetical protein
MVRDRAAICAAAMRFNIGITTAGLEFWHGYRMIDCVGSRHFYPCVACPGPLSKGLSQM